ncbi:MAG: hypothetical protein SPL63_10335, partial [Roseburia faecis]|nr:hypothetical protein [Roseburia faecis]
QVSMLQTKDYQVAVQTKLIANVANMYYTLLMLDKQLQIVTPSGRPERKASTNCQRPERYILPSS